jgi:hypothetical protein
MSSAILCSPCLQSRADPAPKNLLSGTKSNILNIINTKYKRRQWFILLSYEQLLLILNQICLSYLCNYTKHSCNVSVNQHLDQAMRMQRLLVHS